MFLSASISLLGIAFEDSLTLSSSAASIILIISILLLLFSSIKFIFSLFR